MWGRRGRKDLASLEGGFRIGVARMTFHILSAGAIETNAYLLTSAERGEAVLIDAPGGVWAQVAPILASEGVKLGEVWLTHGHWDHMQGAMEVVRHTGARVLAHAADRPLLETPEVMSVFLRGVALEAVKVDQWIEEGDRIEALGLDVEVRHVPGHCPGNVLFYFAAAGAAFVGDALFAGSVGRTDLPGGSMATLEEAIRSRIYTLPEATKVFPGHGPATTVAQEKRTNPHVCE